MTLDFFEFSGHELNTLRSALTIAAERYDEHAKTMAEAGQGSLSARFTQQAEEARALRDRLNEEPA